MPDSDDRSERRCFEAALKVEGEARAPPDGSAPDGSAPGVADPLRLEAIEELAVVHLRAGRYEQAEALYLRALADREATRGREHPANNLAWLYLNQGRYPEAEVLLLDNHEVKRRVLGELHPSTVEGLENLVILYERMGAEKDHRPRRHRRGTN